ncbi:red chlorophyll catabolite reductase-like isoform X2 [Triticum dicoccoides]|uniref:red chlorophyll catabolite reductase-like isoform X2 n=1 Tax=Triticum dicoccoides TaxID=85692 RepID=UPI001891E794|nr:red chlorophyll catabolite reductase-like isoform X2 [Triticum dicoccoides]
MLRPATSVSVVAATLPAISRLRRGVAGRRSSSTVRARMPLVQQEATMPSLAHREVARALAAEAAAAVPLLPSAVPAHVADFQNGAGTAVGMLDVRRGAPASSKDLALHPEYIHKYYEHTHLDKQREKIEELPQTRPYRSPSLFVRSACSPTAVSVTIDCGQGGEGTLEEIVCGHLASTVKEVLRTWLHSCACDTSKIEEAEREIMIKRDQVVRLKSIEVDLTANLPRMFGPDVSGHIIAEIRKAFGVQLQEA